MARSVLRYPTRRSTILLHLRHLRHATARALPDASRACPPAQMFVLGEVAVELFQESPSAFLAELRNGRYLKTVSNKKSVLNTIQELGLPVESVSQAGVTLVPAQTVEQLMQDRRKVASPPRH